MKIRNGFVSNSSSSSFIIRGTKLTTEEIIQTLNIPQEDIDKFDDDEYEIYELLSEKFKDFNVKANGNYFGRTDYSTLIIGNSMGRLEDGEVTEFEDRTPEQDEKILEKFKELGFNDIKLKTYIQFVSNDNY